MGISAGEPDYRRTNGVISTKIGKNNLFNGSLEINDEKQTGIVNLWRLQADSYVRRHLGPLRDVYTT